MNNERALLSRIITDSLEKSNALSRQTYLSLCEVLINLFPRLTLNKDIITLKDGLSAIGEWGSWANRFNLSMFGGRCDTLLEDILTYDSTKLDLCMGGSFLELRFPTIVIKSAHLNEYVLNDYVHSNTPRSTLKDFEFVMVSEDRVPNLKEFSDISHSGVRYSIKYRNVKLTIAFGDVTDGSLLNTQIPLRECFEKKYEEYKKLLKKSEVNLEKTLATVYEQYLDNRADNLLAAVRAEKVNKKR